jgi:hypothetical protein
MTGIQCHNEPAPPSSALPPLIPAMVETLASFRASVRFASTDPATNRFRFYDLRW